MAKSIRERISRAAVTAILARMIPKRVRSREKARKAKVLADKPNTQSSRGLARPRGHRCPGRCGQVIARGRAESSKKNHPDLLSSPVRDAIRTSVGCHGPVAGRVRREAPRSDEGRVETWSAGTLEMVMAQKGNLMRAVSLPGVPIQCPRTENERWATPRRRRRLLGDLADHAARVARGEHALRDIACHDAAGADHRA